MTSLGRPLRAGLIGLGVMGRHHLRVLRGLEGVGFVGAVDPAVATSRAESADEVMESVGQLVDRGIDYAVVAVPTEFHEEVAVALAEAGVHALVEKPLAHNAASAERVARAFDEAGLVGAVGHIERFNPALVAAKARIAQGVLGEVYQVSTRRQGPFPARIADVGVVKDLATHDIDLASWTTGLPYSSLTAQCAFRSGRPHEDLVAVTGRLGDDVVANHLVNWLSPFKERVTVVVGEHGAFAIDTLMADLTFYANGHIETAWDDVANFRGVREGDVTRYALVKREPLLAEHEAFRDALNGDASRIMTMHEGVQVARVADAILTSAESGKTVVL
jgi:predicted dehydrogenase